MRASTKIIVVTGISSGIGKAFVEKIGLTHPQWQVIGLTAHQVTYQLPKNAESIIVDVTDMQLVVRTIDRIVKKYGRIDVLINNAGNGWRGTIEDTTLDEAKRQLELNVWSVINLTQLVLPTMRKQKSGHIINVTSMATIIDYATIGYYSATKSFIEKISYVLALEVESWDIKVSLIAPGAIKTKFGHNMQNIAVYGKGSYKKVYQDWANRFENMFQKPLPATRAADKLVYLIEHPKDYVFIARRDTLYGYLYRIIPRRLFRKFFLKRYMYK